MMNLLKLVAILCLMQVKASTARSGHQLSRTPTFIHKSPLSNTISQGFQVRGGAKSKRKDKISSRRSSKTATGKTKVQSGKEKTKSSSVGDALQKYKQILPLTRIYITMVVAATVLGMILGDELTQGFLALDPIRTIYGLELWRPFTAATFLGPPSIGWLMSGYYLFEYGSSLERAYGTAQFLIFLLSQIVLLSGFSMLFGQPFFTSSVITAMLHVLSRSMPYQKVKWIVFTVPYWSLPYGLMMTDVLQSGNPVAALPHILGILSGHFYHFHKFVWPKMSGGGEDWLVAPQFLVTRLEPNSARNVASSSTSKDALNVALKGRKKGKGRKLGGKK